MGWEGGEGGGREEGCVGEGRRGEGEGGESGGGQGRGVGVESARGCSEALTTRFARTVVGSQPWPSKLRHGHPKIMLCCVSEGGPTL